MNIMRASCQEIIDSIKNSELVICVVGLGQIGLPTAALFAEAGANVIGVDIDHGLILCVNSGSSFFNHEPGLNELVNRVVKEGRLKATTDISAVAEADVTILCLPTSVDRYKSPDYSALTSTCKEVSKYLRRHSVIIIESTVGPGTVEELALVVEGVTGMRAGIDFGMASCPERANPGEILQRFKKTTRVIGGLNKHTTEVVSVLYNVILCAHIVKVSNPKTANLVKLVENIFRDTNIALINELAIMSEKLGIDIFEVIDACATKWNFIKHYPGPGVGGPCLPISAYFLTHEVKKFGHNPHITAMARTINDQMPSHIIQLLSEALNDIEKEVHGSKVAILGVSYKPEVHNVENSPIREIFKMLKDMEAEITLYDALFKGEVVFGENICESLEAATTGADCIILGVAHNEFRDLDITELAKNVDMPAAIIDATQFINPLKAKHLGFSYRGVGRPIL